MADTVKQWGKNKFWGLGFDYDPRWILTEEQKILQDKLTALCRTTLRPNAVKYDQEYTFPRENLDALASLGLLGLIVPKSLGGLGESHRCAVMVTETIARYGCPSTAMVYVMHTGAVAAALLRHHGNEELLKLMPRLDKDKLVGTLSYSDPATGGHYWYPLSSKAHMLDDGSFHLLKYASWTTSAGFADWYIIQTVSPGFKGDYSNLTEFLVFQDEVRAHTGDWSALGLHGNQSGPLITEGKFPKSRQVGPIGDGSASNDEAVDPYFLLLTAACWNGIALGCIDIGVRHVTQKRHADKGMRVCDYPTIQDYFGESITNTNACRLMCFSVAEGMDKVTNDNDWSIHKDLKLLPRFGFLHWCWQLKFQCAKAVSSTSDTMLRACGGTGFKTDLGLERLLRDGKAGWVMGPSNEVLRQWVGTTALFGLDCMDYWVKNVDHRVVHTEVNKMTKEQKRKLADRLLKEVAIEESNYKGENEYQDTEFDNPFATEKPRTVGETTGPNGTKHKPGLDPEKYIPLKLTKRTKVNDDESIFVFALPDPTNHTGSVPGQYVKVSVTVNGKMSERYMSPMSKPDDYGMVELGIRFESHGVLSNALRNLKEGETIDFKGPCGGYEYIPGTLDHISLICGGSGATPAIQIIRCIMANKNDKTKISMLYYAKTKEELLCKEELDQYAAKDGRLAVGYTTDDVDDDSWTGHEGSFDEAMFEKYVPKPNNIKHKILICGGPHTVITACQYLQSLEYPSQMIYAYGPFGVEQVRSVYGRKAKLSTHKA